MDKLRLHCAIVEGGSGFLLQPIEMACTYIVTAKHIFFNTEDLGRGEKIVEKKDGDIIQITTFFKSTAGIDSNTIEFVIKKDENYFPHENADLAILKIAYDSNYESINLEENFENIKDFLICGFPSKLRKSKVLGEWFTNYEIQKFISDNQLSCRAQLSLGTLVHTDIMGMSGCGLIKIDEKGIHLVGIQSKVPTSNSNGQIDFVPAKYINEIIVTNDLYPLNSIDLDEDDFSQMNRDFDLQDKVFAVSFNSESEPYYLKRDIDDNILNYLKRNKNVWISGISGIGKTFLILANISSIVGSPIRIDLTCSQLENIDEYFEYINNEIISQCELDKLSLKPSVYDRISDNLCEINLQSNQILIFVDEVPILDKLRFYNFLTGFIKISDRYSNLLKEKKNINWIISTRINPEEHLSNDAECLQDTNKARKNFNFKNLDLWTNEELIALMKLLQIALNFKISKENEEKIITLSNGLPGVLKRVFETLLLENCTIDKAIDIIKSENV